jgi:hypothetical protein
VMIKRRHVHRFAQKEKWFVFTAFTLREDYRAL